MRPQWLTPILSHIHAVSSVVVRLLKLNENEWMCSQLKSQLKLQILIIFMVMPWHCALCTLYHYLLPARPLSLASTLNYSLTHLPHHQSHSCTHTHTQSLCHIIYSWANEHSSSGEYIRITMRSHAVLFCLQVICIHFLVISFTLNYDYI